MTAAAEECLSRAVCVQGVALPAGGAGSMAANCPALQGNGAV